MHTCCWGLKQKERPPGFCLHVNLLSDWRIKKKKKYSQHRYWCVPTRPSAGLITVQWDNQLICRVQARMCPRLNPCRVSAVCVTLTQLHSSHLDQVFKIYSVNIGVVLTWKSDVCRDILIKNAKEEFCSDFTVEQRWLTTCRIHPVVHANGSLEYSAEMNCVSKGSWSPPPFALNYSLKKIPEFMLWILQWHQQYYFRALRVCFRKPVLMEFYTFPRKGSFFKKIEQFIS